MFLFVCAGSENKAEPTQLQNFTRLDIML